MTSPIDQSLSQSLSQSSSQFLPSPELILDDVVRNSRDVDRNHRNTEEKMDESCNFPLRRRGRFRMLLNASHVQVESPLLSSDSFEIDFPALIARKKLVARQLASETPSSSESDGDVSTGPTQAILAADLQTNSTPSNLSQEQLNLSSSDSDEIDFPALIARKKLVARQLGPEISTSSSSESDNDNIPIGS